MSGKAIGQALRRFAALLVALLVDWQPPSRSHDYFPTSSNDDDPVPSPELGWDDEAIGEPIIGYQPDRHTLH